MVEIQSSIGLESQSSLSMIGREQDQDGFFKLSDEEIDQIMACCKPLPTDVTVQIDPADYCGIAEEGTDSTAAVPGEPFD